MNDRTRAKMTFLNSAGWGNAQISPVAADASFRHYERLRKGNEIVILMDAPPEYEDVRPFQSISKLLNEWGFSAPKILAADSSAGFLILEDFGSRGFAATIQKSPELETGLYETAVDLLIDLHKKQPPARVKIDETASRSIPLYDRDLFNAEIALLPVWYFRALGMTGLDQAEREILDIFDPLLRPLVKTKPVLVLRDYHAENLMCLAGQAGLNRIGLLDFQDAVRGHPAYDLVSLLQDARRDVSFELEEAMIRRYLDARGINKASSGEEEFLLAYHVLGAQRNSKIIGIFTRLCLRDGKTGYLELIPRVWGLLERNLNHPGLASVKDWFDKNLPAQQRKIPDPKAKHLPANAMILAAGLGLRMRPLTAERPKPMVKILGQPMIDLSLAHLKKAGVRRCVINLHHKAQILERHLALRGDRPKIKFSDERARLLDTGGGVLNALAKLGHQPFYILNGDAVWTDGGKSALEMLAMAWDGARMDILMLLIPLAEAHGYRGSGDYLMDDAGRLTRRQDQTSAPYIFGGIQLVHPRLFDGIGEDRFSMNILFDMAQQAGRLYGQIHKGHWAHVGTPNAIKMAEDLLRD